MSDDLVPTASRKATIRDVAKAAGVSSATVSLVLHQKGQLSPLTRERVLEAVDATGYRWRRSESRQRRERPSTYCLVVDDIGNPYFHQLYQGIVDGLDPAANVVSLISTADSLDRQSVLLESLTQLPIDGLVVVPASGTRPEHLARLTGVPFIMAVRNIGYGSFDYIGANPMAGMRLATEHLIGLGHRRIAFVGGYVANYAYGERYAGFASTMRQHGLPVEERYIMNGGSSRGFGREAATTILREPDPPTAFIGYNDLVAIGVMNGAAELGLTPGVELAVVGYDDIPEAAEQPVPLTTVATPADKLGKIIASALDRLKGAVDHDPINITYPPTLVQRQSCGADEKVDRRAAAVASKPSGG